MDLLALLTQLATLGGEIAGITSDVVKLLGAAQALPSNAFDAKVAADTKARVDKVEAILTELRGMLK